MNGRNGKIIIIPESEKRLWRRKRSILELELFVAGTSHDHDMVKVACERSVCVMLPGYQALTKVIGKQDRPNYKHLQERGKRSGLKAGEDELFTESPFQQARERLDSPGTAAFFFCSTSCRHSGPG